MPVYAIGMFDLAHTASQAYEYFHYVRKNEKVRLSLQWSRLQDDEMLMLLVCHSPQRKEEEEAENV